MLRFALRRINFTRRLANAALNKFRLGNAIAASFTYQPLIRVISGGLVKRG